MLNCLVGDTREACTSLFEDLLNDIDEKDLIRKKKAELKQFGIELRNHGKRSRQVLTDQGMVTYSRTMLIPKDDNSKQKLIALCGSPSVYPFDEFLAADQLPLKMTVDLILKCAYVGQSASSYQLAEELLSTLAGINVGDDTIRYATNFVGSLVYADQVRRADELKKRYESGELEFEFNKKGVLYIETDGAMLNTCPEIDGTCKQLKTGRRIWTRTEAPSKGPEQDDDGSSWRENKIGMVFSSDNIHNWTGPDGEKRHRILKKEYVSHIGSKDVFQWHLFECAYRNGYGTYQETVIISDGGKWIASMAKELFPDATRILDLYHLKENIYSYAKEKFNHNEKKYTPWAEEICKMMEEGKW